MIYQVAHIKNSFLHLIYYNCIIVILFLNTSAKAQNKNNSLQKIDPQLLVADEYNVKGRAYVFKNKKDSALYFFDKSIEIAKQLDNKILLTRNYVDYAGLYLIQGNYKAMIPYMKMAEQHFEHIDHYEVKITFLLQKANYYSLLGKKDSALLQYRVAEQFNNQYNPYRNWLIYLAMGELFNQMQDYEKAEKYYLKAYQFVTKENKILDRGHLLSVLLNFYQGKNNYKAAAPYIAEFYTLQKEKKKKKIEDPLEDFILNLTDGQLENNIDFMQSVKKSSLENGYFNEALIANGFMIAYYSKKKKFQEAIQFASEGEAIAQKMNSLSNRYDAKKIKYEILQKAGKLNEAANEAVILFDLKDSVLAFQKRETIDELETKYETEKKQKEIELLTIQQNYNEKELTLLMKDKKLGQLILQQEIMKRNSLSRENILMDSIVKSEQNYNTLLLNENKLKTSELRNEITLKELLTRENNLKANEIVRQQQIKWGLLIGTFLLLISGGIILKLYYHQKKKNAIIQKQAYELEVLMKEIHHRVKNNLQIVSSLLDLQSHTISDLQAFEAVKEGKNRVQSMALIHQNLYNEGNIKGIKLNDYVTNLVQTLANSYNITNEKIKIHTHIDDLTLDVDTMIPLGLVLNELITNALKYAFPEKTNGEIHISVNEKENKLHLKVSDNGKGFPKGINLKNEKSFGLKIIKAFAQKLKASLDIYNNDGAIIEMIISKYKIA